jgi:hypothetical protein
MYKLRAQGTIFKEPLGMPTFPTGLYRFLLWFQGVYTLLTAIWPLIDIQSFLWASGPKTDIWLVKTVGACLTAIALSLLSFLFVSTHPLPAIVLGGCTAVGMACIDFYYTFTNTISAIYLWDGTLETAFALTWIYIALKARHFTK